MYSLIHQEVSGGYGVAPVDIEEVFDGLFPPHYRHHLIVMLRAFFDASKTYPDISPFPSYTIAGFVGEGKSWGKFDRKWRRVRDKSQIDFFRMTPFEAREKPYNTWSDRKRNEVISTLISLIKNNVDFGVTVALSLAEYDSLNPATRKRYHDNPYMWIASICFRLISDRLKKLGIQESVVYVFESGDDGEPEFKHAMSKLVCQSERFREEFQIYSIMPGLKRQFPALDSADFFAWEIGHYVPIEAGVSSESMRSNLAKIVTTVPVESCYLTGESIEDMRVRHNPEFMKELARDYGIKLGKAANKKPYRW